MIESAEDLGVSFEVPPKARPSGPHPGTWRRKPPSTVAQDVAWVYSVLVLDPVHVKAKDSPSPGAWGLYQWCLQDSKNKDEFYKSRILSGRVEGLDDVNAQDEEVAALESRLVKFMEQWQDPRSQAKAIVEDAIADSMREGSSDPG